MCEFELNYKDGREVRKGDRVVFNKVRPAVISEILCPGSMGASEWSCPEGGFLLDFDDGDAHVYRRVNEDIEFMSRGEEANRSDER